MRSLAVVLLVVLLGCATAEVFREEVPDQAHCAYDGGTDGD